MTTWLPTNENPEVTDSAVADIVGDPGSATRAELNVHYVTRDEYEGDGNLPVGGTTGQVLAKASNADHDVAWVDPPAGGGVAPEDLAPVAFSGDYDDLGNKPTLGTAAAEDVGSFATAAQGEKADTAVQPGDLHPVATSGDYNDLVNKPTLVSAVVTESTYAGLTPDPNTIYFVVPD